MAIHVTDVNDLIFICRLYDWPCGLCRINRLKNSIKEKAHCSNITNRSYYNVLFTYQIQGYPIHSNMAEHLTAAIPAVHHIGRSPGFPSSRLSSAPLCQNLPGMRFAAPYTSHCGHNHIIQNHQERFLCIHQCFSYAYSSQFHSKRTLPFH